MEHALSALASPRPRCASVGPSSRGVGSVAPSRDAGSADATSYRQSRDRGLPPAGGGRLMLNVAVVRSRQQLRLRTRCARPGRRQRVFRVAPDTSLALPTSCSCPAVSYGDYLRAGAGAVHPVMAVQRHAAEGGPSSASATASDPGEAHLLPGARGTRSSPSSQPVDRVERTETVFPRPTRPARGWLPAHGDGRFVAADDTPGCSRPRDAWSSATCRRANPPAAAELNGSANHIAHPGHRRGIMPTPSARREPARDSRRSRILHVPRARATAGSSLNVLST